VSINFAYRRRDAMIDFRTLETFVWVATLGSFRGAAAKLHTTQPAVSQRIAQLELQLGVRLLKRERSGVSLTPPGRELISYAERLLRLRAEMLTAVSERNALSGVFRLGVAETIVHTWLPRFIERINASFPRLELEIEVDISPNLRDRLLAQQIDLAFRVDPVSAPSVRNLPLCSFPVAFIASPAIKLPRTPATVADLAQWPMITFARNTQPYVAVREIFASPEVGPVRLHASASLATVVRMALDGIGIAVMPPAIVHEEIEAGRLRILETTARVPDLMFVASWFINPDALAAESVAAIAAEVAATPGERAWWKPPEGARRGRKAKVVRAAG
jgi:DNA-binding transcriptional LysR family regulator